MMTSSETIYSHKYDVSNERSCDVTPLVDLLSRLERVAGFFLLFVCLFYFIGPCNTVNCSLHSPLVIDPSTCKQNRYYFRSDYQPSEIYAPL